MKNSKNKSNIKFNLYKITKGSESIGVWYSVEDDSVVIYASNYGRELSSFFPEEMHVNNTDSQTDYFEKSKIILTEKSKNYDEIRKQIIEINAKLKAKMDARFEKYKEKYRLKYA